MIVMLHNSNSGCRPFFILLFPTVQTRDSPNKHLSGLSDKALVFFLVELRVIHSGINATLLH